MQQTHIQTISKRRIQCMGKCECGRLKGNPCGPLRPNTINVTMPAIAKRGAASQASSGTLSLFFGPTP